MGADVGDRNNGLLSRAVVAKYQAALPAVMFPSKVTEVRLAVSALCDRGVVFPVLAALETVRFRDRILVLRVQELADRCAGRGADDNTHRSAEHSDCCTDRTRCANDLDRSRNRIRLRIHVHRVANRTDRFVAVLLRPLHIDFNVIDHILLILTKRATEV